MASPARSPVQRLFAFKVARSAEETSTRFQGYCDALAIVPDCPPWPIHTFLSNLVLAVLNRKLAAAILLRNRGRDLAELCSVFAPLNDAAGTFMAGAALLLCAACCLLLDFTAEMASWAKQHSKVLPSKVTKGAAALLENISVRYGVIRTMTSQRQYFPAQYIAEHMRRQAAAGNAEAAAICEQVAAKEEQHGKAAASVFKYLDYAGAEKRNVLGSFAAVGVYLAQEGFKRMRALEMFPGDRPPALSGVGSEVYDEQLLDTVCVLDILARTSIKLQKLVDSCAAVVSTSATLSQAAASLPNKPQALIDSMRLLDSTLGFLLPDSTQSLDSAIEAAHGSALQYVAASQAQLEQRQGQLEASVAAGQQQAAQDAAALAAAHHELAAAVGEQGERLEEVEAQGEKLQEAVVLLATEADERQEALEKRLGEVEGRLEANMEAEIYQVNETIVKHAQILDAELGTMRSQIAEGAAAQSEQQQQQAALVECVGGVEGDLRHLKTKLNGAIAANTAGLAELRGTVAKGTAQQQLVVAEVEEHSGRLRALELQAGGEKMELLEFQLAEKEVELAEVKTQLKGIQEKMAVQEATATSLAAQFGSMGMHMADLDGKVAAAQQQAGTAVHIANKARHTADISKAQQEGRDRRREHQQEAGADVQRRRAPRAAAAPQPAEEMPLPEAEDSAIESETPRASPSKPRRPARLPAPAAAHSPTLPSRPSHTTSRAPLRSVQQPAAPVAGAVTGKTVQQEQRDARSAAAGHRKTCAEEGN